MNELSPVLTQFLWNRQLYSHPCGGMGVPTIRVLFGMSI